MEGYWSGKTLGRRAALRTAVAAGSGVAALSLVGCGGSSSSGGSATGTPKAAITDSTKGNPGGSYSLMLPGAITNLSPLATVSGSAIRNGGLVYSALLGYKWGQEGVAAKDYTLEPDLAQALPEQPDELTYVFKLRPGVKFHNGRALVADDVKYSANRYATADFSAFRQTLQTWLDRVDTPDPQTVVFKTKFPFADAIQSVAGVPDGFILCKEFEEGPDTATKMVGSGPFVFVEGQPPVSWKYRKNPDYYAKPYPYFDEITTYAAPDPVKRIANFTTRQVQQAWVVYADDRDYIKKQRPDARFQVNDWVSSGIFIRTDKAPLNDKRVRQALSMTIDRKKIRDAVMQGEGRPDQFFPLAYSATYGTHEVKDLGTAAKYWDFNPAEAKKLLAAAGLDKPLEFPFSCYEPAIAGQWHTDQMTLASATWKELGVANTNVKELPSALTSQAAIGNYDGISSYQTPTLPGVQIGLSVRDNLYWGPNGEHSGRNASFVNNPELSPLADKQVRQLKAEDRKATFRQIEAIVAEEMYRFFFSSTTQTWFWDPSARNVAMPQEITGGSRYIMRWWYDKA